MYFQTRLAYPNFYVNLSVKFYCTDPWWKSRIDLIAAWMKFRDKYLTSGCCFKPECVCWVCWWIQLISITAFFHGLSLHRKAKINYENGLKEGKANPWIKKNLEQIFCELLIVLNSFIYWFEWSKMIKHIYFESN